MSIVDQLDPDGKEITVKDKKYNKDTTIVFNMKAFISLVVIIATLFGATFWYFIGLINSFKASQKEQTELLVKEIKQLKDERITELSKQVNATDGKMELIMLLVGSKQIDLSGNHTNEDPEDRTLPSLDEIE